MRVLSVPCSTGEEPYSIAITLLEAGLSLEKFHINAIDISALFASYRQGSDYLEAILFEEVPSIFAIDIFSSAMLAFESPMSSA